MKTFTVNQNDAGQRLDKFLFKLMPEITASLLYKYIRKKRVKVNGKRSEAGQKLAFGDVLEIYINDEFFKQPEHYSAVDLHTLTPDLDIVYQDENIIIVDKKPGVLVHGAEGEQGDTLITHIQAYLLQAGDYKPSDENSFAPSLCHRLDRNTSGLVIAAKNANALRIINQKIKNREITKLYRCIVTGIPSEKCAVIGGFLIKNRSLNRVFVKNTPEPIAREIKTKYRIIESANGLSLLEVELLTGRTHQIRAHLSSIGHPILGDGKYGLNQVNKKYNVFTQQLCAYSLKFDFKTPAAELDYLSNTEFFSSQADFSLLL